MGKGGDQNVIGLNAKKSKKLAKYTLEEINKHRTPEDAWMICRGKVYDVSGWNDHPGGHVIFSHAGDDFTDVFAAFHPASATDSLEPFLIGELDEDNSISKKSNDQKDFEKGYRDLRAKLIKAGLFKASTGYYVYKVLSNLLILASAVACVVFSGNIWAHLAGAVILALFWQQCGWLAHDFLHHQVFKNRKYGDLMGYLVGNVWQGFSVSWWKNKHNTHHAVPNLHESSPDAHDGDPDIDTMPLLAWSLEMAKRAQGDTRGRFFIAHQALLYFPLLLFARLVWMQQSFVYAFGEMLGTNGGQNDWGTKGSEIDRKKMKNVLLERGGLALYYLWYGAVLAACCHSASPKTPYSMMIDVPYTSFAYRLSLTGILHTLAFFLVSQTACGLFLALVFGLGHNGMATYSADKRPDFWKLQVTTTRNVKGSPFVHWFCGGLQYQVDHHLFPSVPRHHLPTVHRYVEQFCIERGVKYHETTMYEGTVEVLKHLNDVAEEFLTHFPAM